MTARLTALLIWAAVLGGAVAWGLPLFTRPTPVPAQASLAVPTPPSGGSLVRLLGLPPPAPVEQAPVVAAESRFQLLGVVAPRRGASSGLALIAVDGKPARALAVGREIEPGLRLLTVGHREVKLGAAAGAPSVTLTLPPLAEPQRGRPDGPMAAAPMPGAAWQPPGMPAPNPAGVPGMAPMVVPGMVNGVVPGAAFPGAPGAFRPQLLQQQQQPQPFKRGAAAAVPQAEAAVPSLPYQPDGGPQAADGQPGATNSLPTR